MSRNTGLNCAIRATDQEIHTAWTVNDAVFRGNSIFDCTPCITKNVSSSSDSTLNLESMNPEFIFCVCFDLLKMDFYFGIKTDKVKVNCLSLKFVFSKKLTITTQCQIAGEDFVNFCGLLRKHELYQKTKEI